VGIDGLAPRTDPADLPHLVQCEAAGFSHLLPQKTQNFLPKDKVVAGGRFVTGDPGVALESGADLGVKAK